MKNIYTYLDKIQFEKRVKDKVAQIKKLKDSENFDAVVSDFVMLNWIYGLLSDLYEKIYDDIEKDK